MSGSKQLLLCKAEPHDSTNGLHQPLSNVARYFVCMCMCVCVCVCVCVWWGYRHGIQRSMNAARCVHACVFKDVL